MYGCGVERMCLLYCKGSVKSPSKMVEPCNPNFKYSGAEDLRLFGWVMCFTAPPTNPLVTFLLPLFGDI